jgi:hypothetical protein
MRPIDRRADGLPLSTGVEAKFKLSEYLSVPVDDPEPLIGAV